MANPGDLVTLQQAMPWLGQTVDPNGIIAGLISAVSTQIQNFIGYQVAETTYTRTFNGKGGSKLLLPDRPVITVTALTIDLVSIPLAVPPASGFLNDAKFVYLYGGPSPSHFNCWNSFNRGSQNVTVTYTAGYTTVPYDIQQACLNWLSAAFALLGNDPTISALRAGDTQITYGNVLAKLGDVTMLVPPQIAAALLPYRRVAT